MRIALDVHSIGMRKTGNETYMRNLVEQLSALEQPEMDLHFYHTLPDKAYERRAWRGRVHRLRPHASVLRIPLSFPAALFAHGIDLAHFQYFAPPLCRCKTIVTIHDISYEFFPEYFDPRERACMKLLIPLSGRRAAHVITISEYSRKQLIETYGLREERVSVTYLGVSPDFRRLPEQQARAVTERFGLDEPFILGVGNVQPRKNLIRLIRAYARLRKEKSIPHQLVLVGQAAWKAGEVQDEIARLGVAGAVKTTGYVSDAELVGLYNRAGLFAFPSLYEGFGLPIVEAMACGTPVVTSNVTCMPEVAGDAALMVDPLSEREISQAILRVIDSAPLASRMRSKGLEHCRRFNWRKVAEQTAALYCRHA